MLRMCDWIYVFGSLIKFNGTFSIPRDHFMNIWRIFYESLIQKDILSCAIWREHLVISKSFFFCSFELYHTLLMLLLLLLLYGLILFWCCVCICLYNDFLPFSFCGLFPFFLSIDASVAATLRVESQVKLT